MQFDIYLNANEESRVRFPYLLDVQADLLSDLETRVVVPLSPRAGARAMVLSRLMPVIGVNSVEYVAFTPQLAGVTKRDLGAKVENVSEMRTEIVSALDLLVTGS